MTILERFCNVKCLEDGYKFSPSGTYWAPPDGKIEVYRDYIDTLPMNDLPEIFGLHENANITYQRAESNRMISTLLSIQPRLTGGAGGMTPDEIVLEKAKDFLDQLPELLDEKEGLKDLFVKDAIGLIPSLSTVLV
jgi:dynein heavy chain